MTFHKSNYNQYNVTMEIGNKQILIATIRPSIRDIDIVYIETHFPFQGHSETKISTENMVEHEMIDFAKKFIMKKLYRLQNDILKSLQFVEFDDEKHKHTVH